MTVTLGVTQVVGAPYEAPLLKKGAAFEEFAFRPVEVLARVVGQIAGFDFLEKSSVAEVVTDRVNADLFDRLVVMAGCRRDRIGKALIGVAQRVFNGAGFAFLFAGGLLRRVARLEAVGGGRDQLRGELAEILGRAEALLCELYLNFGPAPSSPPPCAVASQSCPSPIRGLRAETPGRIVAGVVQPDLSDAER